MLYTTTTTTTTLDPDERPLSKKEEGGRVDTHDDLTNRIAKKMATTLMQAIELLKVTEDSEFSNVKRANLLMPKFHGITEAQALLDALRNAPEAKKGAAMVNWVDLAFKTKTQLIQDLKDKAKNLKKEASKLVGRADRALAAHISSPRKGGAVCTTRVQLLGEFNGAADDSQAIIDELQRDLNEGKFTDEEKTNAESVASLMNGAAMQNAGPTVAKEAWNTCVRGILAAFAALKLTNRSNDLGTVVMNAMKERVTLCVKPASQSLARFASETLKVLMLGMWVVAKIDPEADPMETRRLYQDDLAAQLRNGANQLESTILMTVNMEPEGTYLERCVHAIASTAGKAMPGQAPKKAKDRDVEFANGEEGSDSEQAFPVRVRKGKGPNALTKNNTPDHEKHFKSITEETTSTFKKRAPSSSDEDTGSDEEEEKKQKEKKKAARAAKKAKGDGKAQDDAIASLAALTEPLTKLAQVLLSQGSNTANPVGKPQANSGECFRDPTCTNPTCRWSHPKRDAAQGQAPKAQGANNADIGARIQKFSNLKACRNFHDFNKCARAACKLTHAKFNENGTPCKTHADKSAICEHSLRGQGCNFKHLF